MLQPSNSARLSSAPRRRGVRVALTTAAAALSLIAAACGSAPASTTASASPPPTPSSPTASPSVAGPSPSSSPSAPASASSTPSASAVRQTQTSWGTIWDALPASIPTYPGAQAAQTAPGAYSASLVAAGANVETVTAWYKAALDRLGYSTVVEPPLEDGSRVLDSTGSAAGCKVQTTVAKQGVDVAIRLLYGADCPFH